MNSHHRPIEGWDVIDQAGELSRRGEEFALATVVWRQGPSSGQQGSRALITATGQMYGWIGGACAEPVVMREARRVIAEREPTLLLLGTPEQFGRHDEDELSVPEGMVVVPISCQSEGALEVYIEPVIPTPQLTVVGRSPMAYTLSDLAAALGWRTVVRDGPVSSPGGFSAADLDTRSIVVIATQGHGDEEAVEQAVTAFPAFVGLVASRRRGEAVVGYLAERGVPRNLLDRVRFPVGLDLGHTTHREIAVAVLAELVKLRAAGGLLPDAAAGPEPERAAGLPVDPVDPVCGMSVRADASGRPLEHAGTTYYFCCTGCHDSFAENPHAYLVAGHGHRSAHQEA